MGVGIELDTENSCRKYQVCKPVAPQRNRNRSDSVAVSCFISFPFQVVICRTVRAVPLCCQGSRGLMLPRMEHRLSCCPFLRPFP